MRIEMVILLSIGLCFDFSQFQGHTEATLSAKCYDSAMTVDGSFFYCSTSLTDTVNIFKNNG